jgi:succinate dehydrogenase / fumarate reductase cytochrome b subunit
VNDKRPVNLDLGSISLPVTAWVSLMHRVSGVVLFAGIALLIYMLDESLNSQQSFAALKQQLASPVAKFLVWFVVVGFIYHTVAGVKHLIMDYGIGETMEGGVLGARLTIATSAVLSILAGVWIW